MGQLLPKLTMARPVVLEPPDICRGREAHSPAAGQGTHFPALLLTPHAGKLALHPVSCFYISFSQQAGMHFFDRLFLYVLLRSRQLKFSFKPKGVLWGGVPSTKEEQLRRETDGCRGEVREGRVFLRAGAVRNRQAGMVVSESSDWSTAIKSHTEYWKRRLTKRPPGPFPVFHVTGVLDVNNLNSPGTFTCWTCLNSDGLVLFSSAETMECMAGFLLFCDVATHTQAFGKSCREEFSELGFSKAEIKLALKVFHGFRTGAAQRQLRPDGTISWSALRLSVPWEVLKEELALSQKQSEDIKKQLDELDGINHIIISLDTVRGNSSRLVFDCAPRH